MDQTSIKFIGDEIQISYASYYSFDEKYYNVYIPAFDIYFSTTDRSKVESRGTAMVKSFFHHKEEKNPLRALVLELHKLGFRAKDHDLFMKRILNHQVSEGVFKFDDDRFLPKDYPNHEQYLTAA